MILNPFIKLVLVILCFWQFQIFINYIYREKYKHQNAVVWKPEMNLQAYSKNLLNYSFINLFRIKKDKIKIRYRFWNKSSEVIRSKQTSKLNQFENTNFQVKQRLNTKRDASYRKQDKNLEKNEKGQLQKYPLFNILGDKSRLNFARENQDKTYKKFCLSIIMRTKEEIFNITYF